jgi:tRNA 2-thiouridine synthesizing protein E
MATLIHTLLDIERGVERNEMFPHAPGDWSLRTGHAAAKAEGIAMTEDHWAVVRALQEYFARHEGQARNMRELHDALDERFHASGGMKYLYRLFPGGPVAQGSRIAGVQAPGAVDYGFGSVM